MPQPRFDALQVGDEIPSYTTPRISRTVLALFAGASGDHNPMHIDSDFAKQAGMDDVFAHGMLIMAYLGRELTRWVPQHAVRRFGVRFSAITNLHDKITCKARVVEKLQQNGEKRVRLELTAVGQDGETKLVGEALVALP